MSGEPNRDIDDVCSHPGFCLPLSQRAEGSAIQRFIPSALNEFDREDISCFPVELELNNPPADQMIGS
jgi:hypothetical protein